MAPEPLCGRDLDCPLSSALVLLCMSACCCQAIVNGAPQTDGGHSAAGHGQGSPGLRYFMQHLGVCSDSILPRWLRFHFIMVSKRHTPIVIGVDRLKFHFWSIFPICLWMLFVGGTIALLEYAVIMSRTQIPLPWYLRPEGGLPSILMVMIAQAHTFITVTYLGRVAMSALSTRIGRPRTWIELTFNQASQRGPSLPLRALFRAEYNLCLSVARAQTLSHNRSLLPDSPRSFTESAAIL